MKELPINPNNMQDSKELKNRAIKNALSISFFYVGLGTVSVLSVYPDSLLYGDWIYIGLLLTLPVSVISFGVMYADPDGYLLVLIVQVVTFFVFGFILYRYLLNRYKRRTLQS